MCLNCKHTRYIFSISFRKFWTSLLLLVTCFQALIQQYADWSFAQPYWHESPQLCVRRQYAIHHFFFSIENNVTESFNDLKTIFNIINWCHYGPWIECAGIWAIILLMCLMFLIGFQPWSFWQHCMFPFLIHIPVCVGVSTCTCFEIECIICIRNIIKQSKNSMLEINIPINLVLQNDGKHGA